MRAAQGHRFAALSRLASPFAGRALVRTLISVAASGVRGAVDLVFPPTCLACRRATFSKGALCPDCWRAVRFIERPYCDRLGTPFAVDYGDDALLSPEAMADPPVYARARAVALFEDGPARRLVHRLKYGDRLELAAVMGAWMARAGDDLLADADLVVPVPLHPLRLARRRYNQAALLARAVSQESGVPIELFALERVKQTPPQVGLTRVQRAANVQGAFRVEAAGKGRVMGKAVVLVDDVITSGATINAACRALLRAGATRVDVVVFARVAIAAGVSPPDRGSGW